LRQAAQYARLPLRNASKAQYARKVFPLCAAAYHAPSHSPHNFRGTSFDGDGHRLQAVSGEPHAQGKVEYFRLLPLRPFPHDAAPIRVRICARLSDAACFISRHYY